jgi:hypothetical protein
VPIRLAPRWVTGGVGETGRVGVGLGGTGFGVNGVRVRGPGGTGFVDINPPDIFKGPTLPN